MKSGFDSSTNEDPKSKTPGLMNAGSKKSSPEIWFYVLCIFCPFIQWILIVLYILKGEKRSAFFMWINPTLVQITVGVIVGICILNG